MPFVSVQPAASSWARRTEDLTSDKTDDKDAVLIARLTAVLRCYLPEPVDETWDGCATSVLDAPNFSTPTLAASQQVRDLLECVWPAALATAKQPFKSITSVAALSVLMLRDGGDLTRTRRLGRARFERQVRAEVIAVAPATVQKQLRYRPEAGQVEVVLLLVGGLAVDQNRAAGVLQSSLNVLPVLAQPGTGPGGSGVAYPTRRLVPSKTRNRVCPASRAASPRAKACMLSITPRIRRARRAVTA